HGGDPVADSAFGVQRQPLHPQPVEARTDRVEIGSGVEQRGEEHVAGGTADAVEVEEPGHAAPPAARAMRAAIVPAPSPSSMFTTATPAAHEQSIDSSAVMPPNAAP